MRRLIFTALYVEDRAISPWMQNKIIKRLDSRDIYYKNCLISLISARKYSNGDCDIALITNKSIPLYLENILKKNNIYIYICPFENFRFPKGYKWEYAFYKINALQYVLGLDYDQYILVDNDVLFIRNTDVIFEELNFNIPMAYEVPYGIRQPMRNVIINDFTQFNDWNGNLYQYGGEFIGGSKAVIREIIDKCEYFYNKVSMEGFPHKEIGDEYLLSMALACFQRVTNAYTYMDRCITRGLYISSTRYNDSNCIMLHLPAEKAFGLYYLANYYLKREKFPTLKKIVRICNLPKSRGRFINITLIYSFLCGFKYKV